MCSVAKQIFQAQISNWNLCSIPLARFGDRISLQKNFLPPSTVNSLQHSIQNKFKQYKASQRQVHRKINQKGSINRKAQLVQKSILQVEGQLQIIRKEKKAPWIKTTQHLFQMFGNLGECEVGSFGKASVQMGQKEEFEWQVYQIIYNFQMIFSRYHFLFAIFLAAIVQNQVLTQSSFCLGNCTTCDQFSLTKCILPNPCDSNFYSQKGDGLCTLSPSTQLVSYQLFQTNNKTTPALSKGWSASKKYSQCEYASSEGKKYIEILGLYTGVQVLERTFQVDPQSEVFELTFDLVLNEWLPFNDFLIVDILSQGENLLSLEVSFDSIVSVDSQAAIITCNGVRVMTKKYNLKFTNDNRVNNQLTATFTSFLLNAVWGITNVRLHQGCVGYSFFNPKTQKCNRCDSDSFVVSKQTADWCQKCPSLCKTCQSKTKCLSCIIGATLNSSGLCDFGDKFKTQVALLGDNLTTCDGQFKMGTSSSAKIALSALKNDDNLTYDQVQLVFVLYYAPSSWKSSSKSYISVKMNKAEVMRVDYRNLTNNGVIRCQSFKDKRAAKIQIFSNKITQNDTSATIEFQLLGNQKGMQFGVSSVRMKSIIKQKPTKPTPAPQNKTNPTPNVPVIPETIAKPISTNNTDPNKNATTPNATTPNATASNAITPNKTNNASQPLKVTPVVPQPAKPAPVVVPQPVKPAPVVPQPAKPAPVVVPQPAKPAPVVVPQPVKPVPVVVPQPIKPSPIVIPQLVKPIPVIIPQPLKPTPAVVPQPAKPTPAVVVQPVKPAPTVVPQPAKPTPAVVPQPSKPVSINIPQTLKPTSVIIPQPTKPTPAIIPQALKPTPVPIPAVQQPPKPTTVIVPEPLKPISIIIPQPVKPTPFIFPQPLKPTPIIIPQPLKPTPVIPEPLKPTPTVVPQPSKPTPSTVPQPPKNIINEATNEKTPSLIIVPTSIFENQAKNSTTPNNTTTDSSTTNNLTPDSSANPSQNNTTNFQVPLSAEEVDKYVQDIITKAQESKNISFMSSTNNQQSGLRIYIDGTLPTPNTTFNIYIDKIDPSAYRLNSFSIEDGKICLFIQIDESFTDGSIAIYSLTTSRLLTSGTPQLAATFKVARFDSLTSNQIKSMENFTYVFSAAAWAAMFFVFIATLIGYGVTVQQFVISLQVLFLHVYIGSEYLPLTFREVIGGLNIVQNLNFFVPTHRQTVQDWMGNANKNIPVRFQLYSSEIFFLREFYPIIIVNLIYLVWFGFVYYSGKRINEDLIDEEKQIHHRIIDNIANRVINFFDQIWRYQFLSTIWFCFIQFYDISSPNRGTIINGVVCVLAFLASISWPVFVTIYCRRQYYELEYSQYLYFYQDIYYGKIPQYQLPSSHHRIGYPLYRSIKLFYIALVICYFGGFPLLALVALIIAQVAQIFYTKKQEIYSDKRYWILRVIENSLFIIIEVVNGVMLACDKIVSSNVYKAMGYLISGLALVLIINGAVRFAYLSRKKYKQLMINEYDLECEQKKLKTERVV